MATGNRPEMNIPVPLNDLDRGGDGSNSAAYSFVKNVVAVIRNIAVENGRMTDAKDLFFRFSIPLITVGIAALCKRKLDEKEKCLSNKEMSLQEGLEKLSAERKVLEEAQGWCDSKLDEREKHLRSKELALEESLAKLSQQRLSMGKEAQARNQLEFMKQKIERKAEEEMVRADIAKQEIWNYQPLIKEWLKIRCSPTTSRSTRKPIEHDLSTHILREPSPFDGMNNIKEMILTDLADIYEKDDAHCAVVWPIGSGDHGELYKVYREKWLLKVEMLKYKKLFEELKLASDASSQASSS